MKLDTTQQEIIDFILTDTENKSIFITGEGGTGKSEIIKELTKYLKSYVALAPTNSASAKINGQTLHSFFKIKPKINIFSDKEENVISFDLDDVEHKDLTELTLIIDESSMIGNTMFNKIIKQLEPKKLIVFGDPSQLKPVKDNLIDWEKYCDKTILLTKNYRINNPKVKQIVDYYRDKHKLLSNFIVHFDDNFDDETIFIAHTNKKLSNLQHKILGYSHIKVGDRVITFGNSNPNLTDVNGLRMFNNGDVVEIETVNQYETFKDLYICNVDCNKRLGTNKYNLYPQVICGDYDVYKRTLENKFKEAQTFQKEMVEFYKTNNLNKLKEEMEVGELYNYNRLWSSYFKIKNTPYARHYQFRTCYKVQGQTFDDVVVVWDDLPSKCHKYVALSRARESIKFIF